MKFSTTKIAVYGLLIIFLSSCGAAYHFRLGHHWYNELGYSKAITEYEKGLAKKQNAQALINLAESYRMMNNVPKAEETYAKVVVLPEAKPILKLRYAMLLMQSGKYASAKTWFESYLKDVPLDKSAIQLMATTDSIDAMKKDSLKWVVTPVSINTGQSNFSPTAYGKDSIVFVTDRPGKGRAMRYEWTGQPFLDLHISKVDSAGTWSDPVPVQGSMNGIFHDGPVVFVNDTTVYVTRNNYMKRKFKTDEHDVVDLKVYEGHKRNGAWNVETEMPFNSNDYSTGHAALSSDGKVMYFVSDMPNGIGGTDIWVSKFVDGKWAAPVNAGDKINTTLNEMFPTVYHDTLYFSSEGHNSMGGLDIFRAGVDNSTMIPTFSDPVNLKYPINSGTDDFGIMFTENEKGYFSSNRTNTVQDNIYSWKKRELIFNVDGIVVETATDQPIDGAFVTMTNLTTGTKDTITVGPDGTFKFKLAPETDYKITATKEMYYSKSTSISTKGKTESEDIKVKLALDKIIINKPIVLENIYYDFDKWDIRDDAKPELNKLVTIMKENPNISVELSSHTDSRASDKYNMTLSQKRAESAVNYIVTQDIDKSRISAKGYGESKLLNNCKNGVKCTEAEHQINRRTEFKVTKVSGQ